MYPTCCIKHQSIAVDAALRSNEDDEPSTIVSNGKLVSNFVVSNDDDQAGSLAETDSCGSCAITDEDLLLELRQPQTSLCTVLETCDACLYCNDRCGKENCSSCANKSDADKQNELTLSNLSPCIKLASAPFNKTFAPSLKVSGKHYYTMCEVRRHNNIGSAWIVVGNNIYDATSLLQTHPGGTNCILRCSGGVRDCINDYKFHSRKGQQLFHKYHIGTIKPCPGNFPPKNTTMQTSTESGATKNEWWMFWAK